MKKNNAVEKVENLTVSADDKSEKVQSTPEGGAVKISKTTKTTKTTKTNPSDKDKKEKIAKQNRTEKARKKREDNDKKAALKLQKKAEKEKAKKQKQQLIKRKKEEYRTEKLRRKEERIARRDMLKHESKEEREKRIAAERQAKINARENSKLNRIKIREQKASVRRQKLADRRALKEQKRQLRMQNRREKRNRGLGGWLAAVIALGSTTLVLATLFTLSMTNMFDSVKPNDSFVAESYYNLVDYVDNMDVNMSKLMVSNDKAEQQRLLGDLTTQASLAAEDISQIPLKDESKYYTTKYINQVADYSKYLNNRLIDGDSITKADKENLASLYSINTVLKEELSSLNADMGSDFDFNSIFNEGSDNMFLDRFNKLEQKAVDYPKLIYDGPFSDSVDKEEPETSESITTKSAEEKFSAIFSDYEIKNVETVGESKGKIDCYNVRADAVDGEIFASLSKTDGSLIMFNHYADCNEKNYGLDECIVRAEEFLTKAGLSDMTSVWATENGSTAYINFCYQKGGVIIYPDMVKVTVCKERGIVSAYDSSSYYLNHKPREVDTPEISQKQAITGLSTDLSVLKTRLCVVLQGQTKEVLCYEVYGTYNGTDYYIYVDAKTGKEVQIFRVVSTLEGDLLL